MFPLCFHSPPAFSAAPLSHPIQVFSCLSYSTRRSRAPAGWHDPTRCDAPQARRASVLLLLSHNPRTTSLRFSPPTSDRGLLSHRRDIDERPLTMSGLLAAAGAATLCKVLCLGVAVVFISSARIGWWCGLGRGGGRSRRCGFRILCCALWDKRGSCAHALGT